MAVDCVRRAVLEWRADTASLNVGGVGMKYVVAWELRPNYSEGEDARSLQVFEKWSPAEGSNFIEFVTRVDGGGGFAVVETDDVTLLARDAAIFGVFFDFRIYPVLDAREGVRIASEAIEFRRSAG